MQKNSVELESQAIPMKLLIMIYKHKSGDGSQTTKYAFIFHNM